MKRTVLELPRFLPALVALFAGALWIAKPSTAQEGFSASALMGYTERVQTGFIDWGNGYAEVDVTSSYDTVRHGASHAAIRAREEAVEKSGDALYRLLRGININGDLRLAGDPALEETLRKVIAKTRKMKPGKTTNLTMNAKFTVPLFGKKALSAAVYDLAFAEGAAEGQLAGSSGSSHTSVVFDASSTTLQAALFPRVLDESGNMLYGPGDVERKVLDRGAPARYLVRYEGDDKKKKKAVLSKGLAKEFGANPLVIQVGKISGDFLADIVLKDEQVAKLREAQVGDLLGQGRIFIIQNSSVDLSGE